MYKENTYHKLIFLLFLHATIMESDLALFAHGLKLIQFIDVWMFPVWLD